MRFMDKSAKLSKILEQIDLKIKEIKKDFDEVQVLIERLGELKALTKLDKKIDKLK